MYLQRLMNVVHFGSNQPFNASIIQRDAGHERKLVTTCSSFEIDATVQCHFFNTPYSKNSIPNKGLGAYFTPECSIGWYITFRWYHEIKEHSHIHTPTPALSRVHLFKGFHLLFEWPRFRGYTCTDHAPPPVRVEPTYSAVRYSVLNALS